MLQACATAKKTGPSFDGSGPLPVSPASEPAPETMGPPELYGPPAPPPSTSSMAPVPAAEPVQKRPVVLIFGPGLARGYAYVGVLRALKEHGKKT